MLRKLGAATAALVLTMTSLGAAFGCSVLELAKKVGEPLQAYKKIEVEAHKWHSTEGGVWHVYLSRNGRLHSIVRTDYGEMGKTQTRVSFLDAKNFGIEEVTELYAEPIYTKRPTKIASRSTVAYFFCDADGVIYMPVKTADDGNAGKPFQEAKALRALFFNAKELAPSLKRLN